MGRDRYQAGLRTFREQSSFWRREDRVDGEHAPGELSRV